MQIGKSGASTTRISQAYPDRVEVRGRDLCGDLMGRVSFTEYFHLLLTGREPTDDQRFFLDLLLVAIAEHGMMPSNVAARMTLAADPGSLHGAVAAGILGCGPVVLGTSESCARLLEAAQAKVRSGSEPAAVAEEIARRATRCRGLASGAPAARPTPSGFSISLMPARQRPTRCSRAPFAGRPGLGKPLPMNVAMPIAVMPTWAFRRASSTLSRSSRVPPVCSPVEEQEVPLGFLMAGAAEDAVRVQPEDHGHDSRAEVEIRPWPGNWRPTTLPRTSSTTLRALGLLPQQPSPPAFRRQGGEAGRDRAAAHGQAGAEGNLHRRIRSEPTSARRRPSSFGSTRRAEPRARRATCR
jgi:citrate synthase